MPMIRARMQAEVRDLFELAAFWEHRASAAGFDGHRDVAGFWRELAARKQAEGEHLVSVLVTA